ncbi:MAG: molybdopterin dinucleotide binding domain-containing protein, partial [Planctomycetota bacterium]
YKSYGHYYLQWAEPILPALGECQPNSWVFKQLASRLGLEDELFEMSTEDLARDLLDSTAPQLEGITLERLKAERSVRLNFLEDFRPYANGSTFSDGKIRFSPAPEQVEFQVQTTEAFPLRLISPPGAFILNTSMGNLEPILRAAGGEPQVMVHPQDAEDNHINDRDMIVVESEKGSITRRVIVSTDAKQGVVIALGQWWPKLAPDKRSLNMLTDQGLTDLGGGSLFGNAVVRIAKA